MVKRNLFRPFIGPIVGTTGPAPLALVGGRISHPGNGRESPGWRGDSPWQAGVCCWLGSARFFGFCDDEKAQRPDT